MIDALGKLNAMPREAAVAEFLKCCGSKRWAELMADARPFVSFEAACSQARTFGSKLTSEDWLEAFRHHPKIGAKKSVEAAPQEAQAWSTQEQAGVSHASDQLQTELAKLNEEYEQEFGYIYIVCATGKSAEEMLKNLRLRLGNTPEKEIRIATEEQLKITELRLRKLIRD